MQRCLQRRRPLSGEGTSRVRTRRKLEVVWTLREPAMGRRQRGGRGKEIEKRAPQHTTHARAHACTIDSRCASVSCLVTTSAIMLLRRASSACRDWHGAVRGGCQRWSSVVPERVRDQSCSWCTLSPYLKLVAAGRCRRVFFCGRGLLHCKRTPVWRQGECSQGAASPSVWRAFALFLPCPLPPLSLPLPSSCSSKISAVSATLARKTMPLLILPW